MEKERNYLWDNIKALLIFLVVVGHMLEACGFTIDEALNLDTFIYSFHMPAFLFVSGFLSKSYCHGGKVRAEKVGLLIACYALFQIIFIIIGTLDKPIDRLSPFNPGTGMWYLLALIVYYLLIPIVEKLPASLVVLITLTGALLVGRDDQASNYLAVSRTICFAPYFFAGYYLSAGRIEKLRSLKAYVRYPLGILAAAASVSIWFFRKDIFTLRFFFAKSDYDELDISDIEGMLTRLGGVAIAALMIVSLLAVLPKQKTFFSYIGARSLQVFLFHVVIMKLFIIFKPENLRITSNFQLLLGVIISLAVTLVLSLKLFSYPFDWLRKGTNKLFSFKNK